MDPVVAPLLVSGERCDACIDGISPPFEFSMAFQPVVDLAAGRIYAYEALVRGPANEPATTVLGKVTLANRYAFDQSCRVKAVGLASQLGMQQTEASLSINFMPGAMYRPEHCVLPTLAAARRHQFPANRLIFELTENEQITDYAHLKRIFQVYRGHSFRTALDDFGSGFCRLGLLAHFQPDLVKLDMSLLRGLDADACRHAVVDGIIGICRALSIQVVAEGVETAAELAALHALGVSLFQGFLFAKPVFEALPTVEF